jgi:uncharacterized membrane protein
MLSWSVVIALALGVYAQRAVGAVLIDTDKVGDKTQRVLGALPLAIIAAVVALATLSSNGELEFDARALGVLAAAVCAWRRLPMFVIVIVAAAVTALLRWQGL